MLPASRVRQGRAGVAGDPDRRRSELAAPAED